MPALVAGIHVLFSLALQGVDGWDKPGHDGRTRILDDLVTPATPRPRRSRLRRCPPPSSPALRPAPKYFRQRTAHACHSSPDLRLLRRNSARVMHTRTAC